MAAGFFLSYRIKLVDVLIGCIGRDADHFHHCLLSIGEGGGDEPGEEFEDGVRGVSGEWDVNSACPQLVGGLAPNEVGGSGEEGVVNR